MNSQDSVRSLLIYLKKKIFDDFGCSVVDIINHLVKLYLTENFLFLILY